MATGQRGERIKTLKRCMQEITSVYDLANAKGIHSVQFINANQELRNFKNKDIRRNFGVRRYDGMSRIGTALKVKILDPVVWKDRMLKPVLVMIVTDGDVSSQILNSSASTKSWLSLSKAQGEPKGLLEDVLRDCIDRLENDPHRGKQGLRIRRFYPESRPQANFIPTAVAFHFSRVGNDSQAEVLRKLADCSIIGENIDGRPNPKINTLDRYC